jgi:putative ABC transport system permease protein
MMWLTDLLPTVIGLAVLALVATLTLWGYRSPRPFEGALAVLRGALQLAVISVILTGVIGDARWVALALLVMFVAAVFTSGRRLGGGFERHLQVAGAMGSGIAAALLIVFITGSIEFSARYILAIGGIVIGNAMTIASLAGRLFRETVAGKWEEVEGWLALGATPREATRDVARRAVHLAMIPPSDQTKTTGLVILPGAFIGAIFGGASPLEAGRFQIVVLGAIIAAGAITAVLLVHMSGSVRVRPAIPTT